jgi:hypothetical protein
MTEQHEGCLAVGQLAQSLKERFRLKAGTAEGSAKQNELPGMVDAQARGERLLSKFVLGPPSVVSSHLPTFRWSPTWRAAFTRRPKAALTAV